MTLDEKCREYVNRLLYVAPFYGWGWWEYDAAGSAPYSQKQRAGPPPFCLRVAYFYVYAGILQGAVGTVEEAGHACDGLFAAFYLHYLHQEKPTDFTDNLATFNIQLGPNAPSLGKHPPVQDKDWPVNDWPVWVFTGRPHIGGYAVIGDSKETVTLYNTNIK